LRRSATAIQITSSRRTVKMTSFYRRSPLHSVLSPWIYIYLFRNLAMSNCVSPHWVLQSECISFWRDWNYIQLCNSWNRLYDGVTKSFRTESITIYTLTTIYTRWETTQRVMAAKLTISTHKIEIQLRLVPKNCTICSSRSRRPVRKLLDTPSYYYYYCCCCCCCCYYYYYYYYYYY